MVLLEQEEWLWFMKSTVNWVTKGERNTYFFHKHDIIHCSSNRILNIRNEVSEYLVDPIQIRSNILRDFVLLYTSDYSVCHASSQV